MPLSFRGFPVKGVYRPGQKVKPTSFYSKQTIEQNDAKLRTASGLPPLAPLPPRDFSTMGEAIAVSSPSGAMSGRSLKAAQERVRVSLFGKQGLQRPVVAQPSEKWSLLRRAEELRGLAKRGMRPIAYAKEAARLEAEAARL